MSQESSELIIFRGVIVRKVINIFTFAALPFFCCFGFFSCAYGQPFVFGPELFFSEGGIPKRVVKSFTVQDIDQEFILSVQSKWSHDPRGGRSSMNVNQEYFVSRDDLLRKPRIFKKPVTLQKQNEISVEVSGEADAPILVAIMSMGEHKVNAKVLPIGEAVELAGYASALFPAGTFEDAQNVTIYVTASPATQNIFEINAAGPRLPYEIRINTGNVAPKKDVEVSVNYPGSFYQSDYPIHMFAQMQDNPDAPDVHNRFFLVSSKLDDIVKTAKATLPKHAFSNRYGKNGTYEAIITVGLTP